MDGRSTYPFVQQNSGDVTLLNVHLTLARYACSPVLSCVGLYGIVHYEQVVSSLSEQASPEHRLVKSSEVLRAQRQAEGSHIRKSRGNATQEESCNADAEGASMQVLPPLNPIRGRLGLKAAKV
eukprot:6173454-Pleurochrysis_carterae.AAC.3